MNKQKIIIIGGGIGGLSVAHELSKYPDKFEIILFERNGHLGGQAAEIINEDGEHTALCWHAVSSNYKYFLNILNEISDEDDVKVIAHLKPLTRFIYGLNKTNCIEYDNSFITGYKTIISGFKALYKKNPPIKDILRILYIYNYATSICSERLKQYDSILWKDYIGNMSPEVRRWVLDSTSIYLGMDYNKLSTHFMFSLMRNVQTTTQLDNKYVFYSFDESMYKVLFKPWKSYLQDRGVKVLLDCEVTKIFHIPNLTTISTIEVTHNDKTATFTADIYINAMDTKNIAYLYPIKNEFNTTQFTQLHDNSKQIQTQVLYMLPYRVQAFNTDPTILILPDTPWFLMVKIEGDIFQLSHHDLLSCGVGMWDVPGLNGKKAINCNRDELARECWAQISNSQHNLKLPKTLPKWNIWDSFVFNEDTGELTTFEPKFSNNINTLPFRPQNKDKHILNLYHATSYTLTNTNVYNMESAAEAGVTTAQLILSRSSIYSKNKKNECMNNTIPLYLKIVRCIDLKLFKLRNFFRLK